VPLNVPDRSTSDSAVEHASDHAELKRWADEDVLEVADKAVAGGLATLGGDGKVPAAQLPALAINDTFFPASEAAMLALSTQRGDVAVRTDFDPDRFFILTTDDPSVLGNWVEITTASTGVTDHGNLTGLGDDDHPQYFTSTRGDARYQALSEKGVAGGYAAYDATQAALALKVDTTELNQLASVEDLIASISIHTAQAATVSYGVLVAPFPLRVLSLEMAVAVGFAASDVDYWTMTLRRYRAGVVNTIASKSTQATGGQALASNTGWNMDSATFDPTYRDLAKDDILNMAFFKTGAAANLDRPIITVRYEPL
jgi:hypothetical protein